MMALVGALLALGVVGGLWLMVLGFRGKALIENDPEDPGQQLETTSLMLGLGGGAAAGGVIYGLTGWPVAAVAALIFTARALFSLKRDDGPTELERTEAIATWTEMIRDNMAGAAGLEQAIIASARLAPVAIRPEIGRFVNRIEDSSLSDALDYLGDELNHRAADLVIAALTNAARMESRDVGDLLARLADSIRSDVRMRLRIETSRSSIRTSARMVIGVTVFTICFLYIFAGDLLDAYDSTNGQLWMILVLIVFMCAGFLLRGLSDIEMPERFIRRQTSGLD